MNPYLETYSMNLLDAKFLDSEGPREAVCVSDYA